MAPPEDCCHNSDYDDTYEDFKRVEPWSGLRGHVVPPVYQVAFL